MASFTKIVFGSCLGFFLAILTLIILTLGIAAINNLASKGDSAHKVLLLDFDEFIPELRGNTESNGTFPLPSPTTAGLFELTDAIKNLGSDKTISSIIIKTEDTAMGFVTMTHIADAIRELRESTDKPIYAYGDYFSQSGYLLASEADTIYMNPEGGIDLRGFGMVKAFGKDFLDKIGVKMHVFYDGEFKSAAEMFFRNEMSENSKVQSREFLVELHDNFLSRISDSRGVERYKLNESIQSYSFRQADFAFEQGAVDGLLQWYEFEDLIRDRLNIGKGKEINYIKINEYINSLKKKTPEVLDNKIAVIYAEGEIQYGTEEYGIINEKHFHETFDHIRENELDAVVLRVNSPGGSSYTSEFILQEIKELQANGVPVIASFGNYAASGGYYIACSADFIIANENTLTGSIGAFSVVPNASKLFNEHLGIHFDTLKTGPYATGFSPFLDLTEKDKALLTKMNNKVYNSFINRVAEGRNMTVEEVENVARGRVWTGNKAVELNLVDGIGTLDDAIAMAAEKAGLENYSISEYPIIEKSKFQELVQGFVDGSEQSKLGTIAITSKLKDHFDRYNYYNEHRAPQLLLPFSISF